MPWGSPGTLISHPFGFLGFSDSELDEKLAGDEVLVILYLNRFTSYESKKIHSSILEA
jgi:hypothetical protein